MALRRANTEAGRKMDLTRQAVRVYSALSALRERRDDDVMDALIPFFVPILEVFRGRLFAPLMLVMGAKHAYGWRITNSVAEVFRDRLRQKGYLTPRSESDPKLVCTPPEAQETEETVALLASLNAVCDRFTEFCTEKGDLFSATLDRDRLESILIRFLVSLNSFGPGLMAEINAIERDADVENPLKALRDGGTPPHEDEKYLCAQFIKTLYKEKSSLFGLLGGLAGVGLLTEVVQDFVKPTSIVANSQLTIILDAPVIFELLGLCGRDAHQEARAVFDALKRIGCSFAAFQVSYKEIDRVLSALLKTPRQQRHGTIHTAILRGETTEEFVSFVKNDPESAVKKIGIATRPATLDDFPGQMHRFPPALFDDFVSEIRWYSEDARFHDAECLALVMRMRDGNHRHDPLGNKLLFVTSNSRFAGISRSYCLKHQMINENQCGPVMHYNDLATAAWLRTGLSGSETLPMSHLIAQCSKILRVKREVVDRARDCMRSLGEERLQQLDLLLLDSRAVTRLMDSTLGNENYITDDNAERLLNEMIQSTTDDVRKHYESKIREKDTLQQKVLRQQRVEHERALEARNVEIEQIRKQKMEQEEKLAEIEKEKERLASHVSALKYAEERKIEEIITLVKSEISTSNNEMHRTARLTTFAVYLFGGSCFLYASSGIIIPHLPLRWTAGFVGIVVGLIGAYHLVEDVRQKPKVGVATVLNWYVRRNLTKRLMVRGIELDWSQVRIDYGQIFVPTDVQSIILFTRP